MAFSNIAKPARTKCLTFLVVFGVSASIVALTRSPLALADTSVSTTVCGPGMGSTITIDSPPSDSIVSTPTVTVSGSVSNATQIDVYIDGQYDFVLPLSDTATSYSTSVTLSSGTHTIQMTAVNVCSQGNVSASDIITYQPATPASNGGNVPTSTPGQPNGPGTGNKGPSAAGTTTPTASASLTSPQQIIQQVLLAPLRNAAQQLNLSTVDTSPLAPSRAAIPNYVRFALLILGTVLIFASAPLSLRLMRLARRLHIHLLASAKAMYEERITFIVTGLISIVLVFTV